MRKLLHMILLWIYKQHTVDFYSPISTLNNNEKEVLTYRLDYTIYV